MAEISQRQLRNDNAEIIRRVERGERFTVTRHGRPVARLGGIEDDAGDPFVAIDGLIVSVSTLPSVDYRAFRAGLDALVDSSVDV